MKILMLSWEYPPKTVGGLSTHVYNLCQSLKDEGNEVHVVTCEEENAVLEQVDKGVFVHRVIPYKLDTEDFTKWVMHLNFAIIEEASKLINTYGGFDLIHAHDWLTTYSAKCLKWIYKIPMVSTIHATEYGRNGGIRTELQKYISSAEWMLANESWKIVTCSSFMKKQVCELFSVQEDKVWIIPNGVNAVNIEEDLSEFRKKYALDNEKIVLFIGRHVFEKGIQILIDTVPGILKSYPNAKFVIAGKGPMTEELEDRVCKMGLKEKVLFSGYMNDEERDKLYKVSNAAVFPSLYEPFGIVALEAMAAGCPVVVSNTGGLSEIVQHKLNGLKVTPGSCDNLRDSILEILSNDKLAEQFKENGLNSVKEKYEWHKVAELTMEMYNMVKEESKGTEWETKEDKKITKDNTEEKKIPAKKKSPAKKKNTTESIVKKKAVSKKAVSKKAGETKLVKSETEKNKSEEAKLEKKPKRKPVSKAKKESEKP
ncbi:glycosyltransferase family 4 protein [Clostridium sp. JN-9]|uniref:glycosyltransferase family 4 protein n=1 Tax=Clostridium sp. JN-9 TaxID=2507159 RepID=UPI000FFE05BC|nr:glycosyltransferase family 4 protein [Clostridium sp. JN-9]QAT41124.1 glycosyltransferase family 1 protein [Clostridium sp. JN-9]